MGRRAHASSVPVDLMNPGQVFACVGLMEAAELLCGPSTGAFVGHPGESVASFELTTASSEQPVNDVLDFLWRARVRAIVPCRSTLKVKEPGIHTVERADLLYPCARPRTPSALPIELLADDVSRPVPVEHWADESRTDKFKLWAGLRGYSGAALAHDALAGLASIDENARPEARRDPFSVQSPMTSSFRLDWRRDYIPLDAGFSPNNHGDAVQMVGYPFVELLAAIGLQHARPSRIALRDKLAYRYAVSSEPLPTSFVRAVLGGGSSLGFPVRYFRMRLGWPAKQGQARCIVDTQEELGQ